MDKLEPLTTPTARLAGSLATIGVLLAATLLVARMLGGPLERAVVRAQAAAERAWITTVLGGSPRTIDLDALSEHVDPVLFATTTPVMLYAPMRGAGGESKALSLTTPDGYNGPIKFAFSVAADGRIESLGVISHSETRGFGAEILKPDSRWLAAFRGRSLARPERGSWRLRADGGAIDGVSGATVTADAMITAINRGLRFLERRHASHGSAGMDHTGGSVGR